MSLTENHLSLSNIEKLVQIGNVYGNVVVKGDVLVSFGKNIYKALGYSSQPENSLTDYIVELADKFGEKELISLEVGLEINLSLLIHPNPTIAMRILSKIRPSPDINSLLLLFGVAKIIADETRLFESLQIDKTNQIEMVGRSIESTNTYKALVSENIPNEVTQKLLDGYFRVLGTGEYSERLYFMQNPELLLMSTDLHIAKICVSAFLNSDERVVNEFMDVREYLASFRKKG